MTTRYQPFIQAILAAILFGASAPIAKLLLAEVEPIPLAGFVYLGSGMLLLLLKLAGRLSVKMVREEAPLVKADIPWVVGSVLAGGIAAPIALMLGLRHTAASTASLLLNFEGVATTMIALLVFREAIGARVWWAVACVTAASASLSWDPSSRWGLSVGAVAVLAACVLWGIDNNSTGRISAKDPVTIVMIKGLCAGGFTLALAAATGSSFPKPGIALTSMAFGSVSCGLSIVLFILALRGLGAARTGSLIGIAPFVGAALSLLIFRNTPSALFLPSLVLMVLGAWLLLSEKHAHRHTHDPFEHEHRHNHVDDHHLHAHEDAVERPSRSHSHRHLHAATEHSHGHTPDDHHRHGH